MKRTHFKLFSASAAVIMVMTAAIVSNAAGVPTRSEIPDRYKWKTSDMFPTDTAWEQDFEKTKGYIDEISKFKGKVGESAKTLLGALTTFEKMSRVNDNLYIYAHLNLDADGSNSLYQGMAERTEGLNVDISSAGSFLEPEILSIPREKLDAWMSENKELKAYAHYFDDLFRNKAHTLLAEQEELLAMAGDLADSPNRIYDNFRTNDVKFSSVKDSDGKEIPVTEGRLSVVYQDPDRKVREDYFKAIHGEYKKFSNTLAATLGSEVKKNIFFAKARKYSSSLEAALYSEAIPTSVYNNLIKAVDENLKPLHKYVSLRKKILGLDSVHQYDMYVNLVKDVDMEFPYDESKSIVLKGLSPLGGQYLSDFEKGLNGGWIDVYENQNKYAGGYQWGTYESHPYILMNYNDDIDSIGTLAHEMGHALHSYYSNSNQPYVYSDSPIFLAEVASTTNEMLLQQYLLKTTEDKAKKLYIINEMIENIRGSVYTQVMYAEFEKVIHERAEAGQSLTAKDLCSVWKELMTKYFGPDFVVDDEATYWWARIPHFYMDFYVYKYATGMAAAVAFAQKVQEEGQPAVDKYLGFLKSGSSKYPIDTLKDAGVDMESPEPVAKTLQLFDKLVDEMSALVDEK